MMKVELNFLVGTASLGSWKCGGAFFVVVVTMPECYCKHLEGGGQGR